jgi:hypothetical protein
MAVVIATETPVSIRRAFDLGFDVGFETVYYITKDGIVLPFEKWRELPFSVLEEEGSFIIRY